MSSALIHGNRSAPAEKKPKPEGSASPGRKRQKRFAIACQAVRLAPPMAADLDVRRYDGRSRSCGQRCRDAPR